MNIAPDIRNSSEEERRTYVKNRYPCIADCDLCGICAAFHGKDPELAYHEYILGYRSFEDVSKDCR